VTIHRLLPGQQIARHLTVLGVIDAHAGQSLCIVWNHEGWCPMACKVLTSSRRAAHEAGVLSQLAHPNIVRSFGFVPPTFLLLEFLEGFPLDILLRKRPSKRLSISDAARVGIHIAAALGHIHLRGFLHMDVKPGNVMVTKSGRPVLFDFGSARNQQEPRPPYVEGTDPYMAPEECAKGEITPKADTFGLGVTLYEMLAGTLPFPTRKKRWSSCQTRRSPVPVRYRRPKIPRRLDDLVLSCLSINAAHRPLPADLMPELHRFISAGPQMWPNGFNPTAR
jgi:serine/threonine protein kinase